MRSESALLASSSPSAASASVPTTVSPSSSSASPSFQPTVLQTDMDDCCMTFFNETCVYINMTECYDIMGDVMVSDVTAAGVTGRPFTMPWYGRLSWSIAFVVMLAVAIGGNSLVCWIILAHRHMRTVTNYFLVNLSVANLLMSSLNTTFNFVYMVHSDWWFGTTYCIINNFIANLTVSASVLTLMAVALERYLVIVHPLRRRIRKWQAVSGIVGIWLGSAGLSMPCLLYSTIVSRRFSSGEEEHGCILVWSDGPPTVSFKDYVYNMIFLCLTYVLPMLAMAVSYSIIGRHLWGAQSIGVQTDRQVASIKSKRKIVRMFIIVVATFALSWLPYQVYFVYTYHDTSLAQTDYVQHLFLAFYWLAMSYSMVNPLIYFWMNGSSSDGNQAVTSGPGSRQQSTEL